ncbi:winged helix-turn-helix domain-containing protein [Streptomyces sp. NPDC047108]|uniref:winged helix-turn-helix domain-containing protein n=1 Tax=Streptomyces sp. NPDC047108 TaxID=3155025 RepID=UPI003404274C
MTTTRSLSASSATAAPVSPVSPVSSASSVPPLPAGAASATLGRHRLRAVDRDEVVHLPDFLPPGATWVPAPQHTLPALPGRPPMVGYLVLVPADEPVAGLTVAPASAAPSAGAAPAPVAPGSVAPAPVAPGSVGPGTVSSGTVGPLGAAVGEDSGPLRIDEERRTVHVDGRPLDLTYLEFELLAHLVAHPQRVHSRDHLVTTVWGYGHVGDGRTVDVHIARLRRKLGAAYRESIVTVRRVGYKYVPPTAV